VRGHDVGAEGREALSMDDVETAARDEGRRQEKREDGCERARAPRDDTMSDGSFGRPLAEGIGKDVDLVASGEALRELRDIPAVAAGLVVVVNNERDSHRRGRIH